MTITGKAVWEKINKDPEFQQQPETVREAIRPYVEALPTILGNMLDVQMNLSNLMRAKVTFLGYCVANGFVNAAVSAMRDEDFGFLGRDGITAMLEVAMSGAIEAAAQLTGDVTQLLADNGVTEQEVLLSDKVGFNAEVLAEYTAQTLTVGRLLILQPMLIVKNS